MGSGDQGRETFQHADKDGHFRRSDSVFRDFISKDPNAKFPPEKDRYVLYVNYGCPWAHRSILVRGLKALEPYIQLVLTDFDLTENGWLFTGRNGSAEKDPVYGFTALKQLYFKADPNYTGRFTVPCLWDKKTETVVNNESSEVIRMFYDAFDEFLDSQDREVNKPGGGFYPEALRSEIDAMNDWVYHTVNNGVYKCGFATSQDAYDTNIYPLFKSLDRLEAHLEDPQACRGGPFLFGEHLTEADVRLYTTLARFDMAYHTIFQCNLKSIRHDYPRLSRWLRRLYWNASHVPHGEVFTKTTQFDVYPYGYARAKQRQLHGNERDKWTLVVPRGPAVKIDPWTEEDEAIDKERQAAYKASDNTLNGANADNTANSATAAARPGIPDRQSSRTAHEQQNQKWYKEAEKAEKQSGAPNMHLALS